MLKELEEVKKIVGQQGPPPEGIKFPSLTEATQWATQLSKNLKRAEAHKPMAQPKYKNVSSYTPSVSYTYPGILTKELFQKPKIDTPALTDFAKIRQGIRSNEYLHLVAPLTSILSKAGTSCGPTYTGVGEITDRKITVGTFDLAVQWCKKDFQNAANSFWARLIWWLTGWTATNLAVNSVRYGSMK